MKVILPVVNDSDAKKDLAEGFHNAACVCIYDCDTNNYQWLLTSQLASKPGNLSLELKRRGISTIIAGSMSLMALGLFTEGGFFVYKSNGDDLYENIQMCLAEKLEPFTLQSVDELKNNCSSTACKSCSSSCK